MSPRSTLSIAAVRCFTRVLKNFPAARFCAALILISCLLPAFAQSHITISSKLPGATTGQPYSATISLSGGSAPYNFVVDKGTSLPSGLTLASNTGTITGTPSAAGTYGFHVTVTGGGGSQGDKLMSLTVGAGSGSVAVSVSPKSATVTSGGSQSFTAYVTGTSNTAVTWTASAGTISTAGLFTAPTVSATTSVSVTATSVADTTKHASATVSVTASTGSSLTITTTSLPGGTTGSAYGAALSASGGTSPYTWSVSAGSLPAGISLNSTGLLAGTPTSVGSSSFTVKVTDSASATATQGLSLTVSSSSGGTFDGPAELPRVYVQSLLANTPAPGTTITLPAGGNLQNALNAANCGDTVSIQAGASFSGKFTLPAKACDDNHWIIVRTSAPDSSLPAEGTRMTPCYAGVTSLPGRPSFNCTSPSHVLAQLSFPAGGAQSGPLALAVGANHYRLIGLEITRPVGTGSVSNLVSTGQTGSADHIIVDRCWIHGTTHDETRTGITFRGVTYGAVVDSYLNDLHCISSAGACTDATAVGGGNGSNATGPLKIVDNFLESSGENILFGGASASITPADIEIRRNHIFKPLLWIAGAPGFIGGPAGNPFIVKNHIEFKNGQRVLIEGNIMEGSWGGFSQTGASILLTPRNQYNKKLAVSVCSICTVTDITIRYNTISHVGGGLHMGTGTDHGAWSMWGARYSIHDIVIDDVNATAYNGGGGLVKITSNRPQYILNTVTINHITGFPDPSGSTLVIGDPVSQPKMWNFLFTNNLVSAGRFPLWNAFAGADCALIHIPTTALPACFSSYGVSHNAIIATPSAFGASTWPSGNAFPASTAAVQFVNYNNGNGGDYHLLPSSPYANAGSDGKDLGADINAVQAAIAGVN